MFVCVLVCVFKHFPSVAEMAGPIGMDEALIDARE